MKRFRQSLANLLEQSHTAAQRDIPAGNIIDQVRPRTLPPATATTPGGVVLSDDPPEEVSAAVNIGTATTVSRSDHKHPLEASGVTAGVYGDTTHAPALLIDATGRIIAASSNLISFAGLSPLTTRGDLITRSATVPVRLAIGASGRYLRSDGTDPSWSTLLFSDLVYSGLTTGQPLRATGATTAAFGALDLANSSAITNKLPLASGGTNADLSATGGAGQYLKQASAGAAITVGAIPYTDLTYSGLTAGQVPRATSATAAAFGALDLANSNAVTGLVGSANGGTGVNNAGRTLTVNTNSGILDFTAASKTLTIAQSLTLTGVSGKTLTLNVDATIDSGTYTPTYEGSTTAGTTTYSAQQGSWWRFGQAIFFTITLAWTGATGTGQVRILLPFTAANVTNQNAAANLYHTTVTFANGSVVALISQNSNLVRLFSPATNANGTELAIEAAGTLAMSGCFFI